MKAHPVLQIAAFYVASYRAYRCGPQLVAKYIVEALQGWTYLAIALCFVPFLLVAWGVLSLAIARDDKLGRIGLVVGMVGAAAICIEELVAFGMSSAHPLFTDWGIAAGVVGALLGLGALSFVAKQPGKWTKAGEVALVVGVGAIAIVEAAAFVINKQWMSIAGDHPWFTFWGTVVGIMGATAYVFFALHTLRATGRQPSTG